MAVDVVWFKRDLRVADHEPLAWAAAEPAPGGVVYLYVYEPDMLRHPTHHGAKLQLVNEALAELRGALRERGADVSLRVGEVVTVLASLHSQYGVRRLLSHQETGHAESYARDRRVAAWCDAHGVPWLEARQDGVVRALRERSGWAARWRRDMRRPIVATPVGLPANPDPAPGALRSAADLELPDERMASALPGGERAAARRLESFLRERGRTYTRSMSSPVTAWEACSRISIDLACGTLSLRTAWQAVAARQPRNGERDASWTQSERSFERRLAWRSHFMQKLESEWRIERRAPNRALDDLRTAAWDQEAFDAWREGRTGYPLVDASMRALAATGWLPFRMRAMLVSFACYHLWLDWRPVATELARRFLDFEPGIHYPQVHMQSGVTGINRIRIYNPWKQAVDHDPHGVFVRTWCPELADVPEPFHLRPHEAPPLVRLSLGAYPQPIVDHAQAYGRARDRVYAAHARSDVRREAERVLARHVARKSG